MFSIKTFLLLLWQCKVTRVKNSPFLWKWSESCLLIQIQGLFQETSCVVATLLSWDAQHQAAPLQDTKDVQNPWKSVIIISTAPGINDENLIQRSLKNSNLERFQPLSHWCRKLCNIFNLSMLLLHIDEHFIWSQLLLYYFSLLAG